ncbi:MAG TPA: FAD-dependent oxidoreductase [Candidatus Paceibacterota bacterium]
MRLTLVEKKKEAGNAVSFVWESEIPVSWSAGQFLHYTLPHEKSDDRSTRRWFTISSAPHEGHIMFTTRFAEQGSSFKHALQDLSIGGVIGAEGPEGEFVVDDPNRDMVFIAGGIGITPYRSILADLDHRGLPINVTLLYANRDSDFIFKEELEALAEKHPTFTIHYFVEPNRIDESEIRENISDMAKAFVYLSGPEPMAEAFEEMLLQIGISDTHIKRDYFPGYLWP